MVVQIREVKRKLRNLSNLLQSQHQELAEEAYEEQELVHFLSSNLQQLEELAQDLRSKRDRSISNFIDKKIEVSCPRC